MKTLLVSMLALGALVVASSAEARVHHRVSHKAAHQASAESDGPHRHQWITPLHKTAPEPATKSHHGKAHAVKARHGKAAKTVKSGHAAKARHAAKAGKAAKTSKATKAAKPAPAAAKRHPHKD